MYQTKEIVQEIRHVVNRRKRLLIITPLFFVLLSIGALYVIEPKYESSISILVQKEETLNPLILYEMAVNIASEDRLKSFNEIIYSRSTMELLIDSLDLDREIETELQKQELVDILRKNISTSARASDSFEIIYYDTDPVRARDGVALLANHFIQTRLRLENKRNKETVEFFENKIAELEKMVDSQRNQIVSTTTEQLKDQPVDRGALQNKLQGIDGQLDQVEWRIIQEEDKLKILQDFLDNDSKDFSLQPLYRLSLADIPLGNQLGELLSNYDELKQKFTESYPRMRELRSQVREMARRIPPAIESNLSNLKRQKEDLKDQRVAVINDIEKSFIASQQSNSQQSNFSIYQQLYSDMKVKLEQARITREIGDKASEQFVVLDPPYIAEEPTSPNNQLVIGLGLFLGVVFGMLFMGIAEALDTTVRTEEDLEYTKPVIAYLTDGKA